MLNNESCNLKFTKSAAARPTDAANASNADLLRYPNKTSIPFNSGRPLWGSHRCVGVKRRTHEAIIRKSGRTMSVSLRRSLDSRFCRRGTVIRL